MRAFFGLTFAVFCLVVPVRADTPAPESDPAKMVCGASPGDWCEPPQGDPCGVHKSVEACKADLKCEGLPYVGESVVACESDLRCFSNNCPTVGCVSACESMTPEVCATNGERCETGGEGKCRRKFPCAKSFKVAGPEA